MIDAAPVVGLGQAGDPTAGDGEAPHFPQHLQRIADPQQQEVADAGGERAADEGQPQPVSGHEGDGRKQCRGEAVGGWVEVESVRSSRCVPGEIDRDGARAGSDLEHSAIGGQAGRLHQPVPNRLCPARLLPVALVPEDKPV